MNRPSELLIREMTLADVPVVLQIDQLSFPLPWPERSYRFELTRNPSSHLMVAEADQAASNSVIGFIGSWLLADEVHISTLAVHPEFRRQGTGEQLLLTLLHWAVNRGAEIATLEVRISNQAAIRLYQKFGFIISGRKPGYYRDNQEDAFTMIASDLPTLVAENFGGEA
jgi:ribosomal-protein-alanine N-acetyltransferase